MRTENILKAIFKKDKAYFYVFVMLSVCTFVALIPILLNNFFACPAFSLTLDILVSIILSAEIVCLMGLKHVTIREIYAKEEE